MVLLKGTNAGPANATSGTSQKAVMESTQSTVFLFFFGIISSDSACRIKFVETGYALDCFDTSHDLRRFSRVSPLKKVLTGIIRHRSASISTRIKT